MNILIVDDEKIIRMSLKRVFEARHKVEVAQNGKEALELINKKKPDVILLDWIMPEMNGREFCLSQQVKELKSVIIVMSAYQNDVEEIDWQEYGVSKFLKKPFKNINEILSIVESSYE